MKKITFLISYLLLLTVLKAQEISIKSEESIIEFNYVEEGALGTIKGVEGKIKFDLLNLNDSYFEASANIASINTSNKTRDKHLNAPDYFHTEKYPAITFKSDSISTKGNKYLLYGKMTIKDITKSEQISFTFEENVFNGRCVVFSNDYKIKTQKSRDASKILVKITVPVN
ncbi:MAG: YceI family protein [Parvicellaceae bacterium]|jgi:polyisoprenoid-binding protein YceI